MFAKVALIALLSSAFAAAAPQSPAFGLFHGHGNGTGPGGPVASECVTSYSTSTYTIDTTIPIVESKTVWTNYTTTVENLVTKVALKTDTTVITSSTPTCITTSYPVQIWITKVIDTVAPVLVTESCTETSTYTSSTCSTITTSVPSVTSCTEYSTSCITSTTVIPSTTCTPCATPKF